VGRFEVKWFETLIDIRLRLKAEESYGTAPPE
jgi:hypothetical protein